MCVYCLNLTKKKVGHFILEAHFKVWADRASVSLR